MSEGWQWVQDRIAASPRAVEVVQAPEGRGRERLGRLQISDRSPLAGVTLNAAGLLVDGGWLRVLGCGGGAFTDDIATWNGLDGEAPEPQLSEALLVGHDAVGGFFAWSAQGGVAYLAPDSLEWQDVAEGYSDWLDTMLTGDLDAFARGLRWPGWEQEVAALAPDQGLSVYPPPWSEEGRDLASADRRAVPMRELWSLQHQHRRAQLGD
jgi:hypothetical protein